MTNLEKLLTQQKDHMNNDVKNKERKDIHNSWFNEETVDYWRHHRMYQTFSSFAKYFENNSWVTIGDGRYGLDSQRLKKLFNINSLPTDISENMLKIAKDKHLINNYSVENAESLSFEDDSFDIVFCKEAFHHCPRPIIALYEMLRVAREAVILIEPNDTNKNHDYEVCGNFVYTISNKEINKIVHGLNLGGMAYFTFNDIYLEGCEFEKAEENNELFIKLKELILAQDGLGNQKMSTTIIFKKQVDSNLKNIMIEEGYIFPLKVNNPYSDINKKDIHKDNSLAFSKDYNKFYEKIELLHKENKKYIVYGNGTIGKTIQALLADKVVGYVDISDEKYHPKTLNDITYDKIIISVLGREKDICDYLLNEFQIPKENIIIFTI